MKRAALTDRQWEAIEPLLPHAKPTGRPRRDLRVILDGILWVVRTGAPWRDLPERFGPWQTAYDWCNRWRRDGTWDRVLAALQMRLDAADRIDWDLWCVDGSNVRAGRAAAGAGEKGVSKSPQTTRWAARAADSAANSTWSLTVRACPSPLR